MPIYEYVCRGCSARFEVLVRGTTAPACPECRSDDLQRLLSFPTVASESTREVVRRETRRRDAAQAKDQAHEQRKYELSHDD